jgi:uncharacterized repeat protein (TIGR03803 family)
VHLVPFVSFKGGASGQAVVSKTGGFAGLAVDESGNFYGASAAGGDLRCKGGTTSKGCGVIYELERNGAAYHEKILHVFRGPDGATVDATMFWRNGWLYGTAALGGDLSCGGYDAGCGTAFEVRADGSKFRVLLTFNGTNGSYPEAPLVSDPNGDFYGTTLEGGIPYRIGSVSYTGVGLVFKLTRSGSAYKPSVVYYLNKSRIIFPSGNNIFGGGALVGGAADEKTGGVVYKLTLGKGLTILHTFKGTIGYNYIYGQVASLSPGADEVIFGVTYNGFGGNCPYARHPKSEGCGALFSLTPAGTVNYRERTIHAFNGPPSNGTNPGSAPVLYNGVLYGTTSGGGITSKNCPRGCGVLYSVLPDGSNYTVLHRFTGGSDGAVPSSLLLWHGAFYGLTAYGGQFGFGTAYTFTP